MEFEKKNRNRRGTEINGVSNVLRILYKSISPLKETGDFGVVEFMDFAANSNKIKIASWKKSQSELKVGKKLSTLLVKIQKFGKKRN